MSPDAVWDEVRDWPTVAMAELFGKMGAELRRRAAERAREQGLTGAQERRPDAPAFPP